MAENEADLTCTPLQRIDIFNLYLYSPGNPIPTTSTVARLSMFTGQTSRSTFAEASVLHIVIGKYLGAANEVRPRLKEHHHFLEAFHRNGVFLLSGVQSSGAGNIIVAQTETREDLVDILGQDTLSHCGLIAYEMMEFALNPRTIKLTEELFRGGRSVSNRVGLRAFPYERPESA